MKANGRTRRRVKSQGSKLSSSATLSSGPVAEDLGSTASPPPPSGGRLGTPASPPPSGSSLTAVPTAKAVKVASRKGTAKTV